MIAYVIMQHSLFNVERQTSNIKRQTSNNLISQLRRESIYARYCSFVIRGL